MIKASKSRIISLILVAALVIGMVPMTAFAFKANPTPSKPQVPIGATSAVASNVTVEETTSSEFPVADTQVDVTLSDSTDVTTTVHFANVPTVSGSNAHNVSLMTDTHLRFTINGSAGTDLFTISNVNYKVDSGAATGDMKFIVAVTNGDTNTFNNATIVNGVFTGLVGTKTSLSASGSGISVAGISATESAAGQFQATKTISLSLANTGVTFTQIPTTTVTGTNLALSSGTLSGDFKTASWIINMSSTNTGTVTFGGIKLDIASSTAAGDINVNITTSGTTPINPAQLAVANLTVSGTIAASATSKTITTGNGKSAGDITLTESQAKSFTTTNNPLTVALGNGATFQVAPTATGSGGITFASGSSSVTSTAGTLASDFKTATWTINSQSTSTGGITISGIMINVPAGTTGDITATVTGGGISGTKTVTIATLASGSIATVSVGMKTAIKVNVPNQPAADVTIKEASAGSLATGSAIYLNIFGQNITDKPITFSQLPTVKVTSGDVTLGTPTLDATGTTVKIPVTIKSGSASTIKVSDIKYDVNSKAINGDVTLDVRYSATGNVFANASRLATVANATIGAIAQTFSDVPSTHFAFNAVQFLSSAGIINGRTSGLFDPNASITRGEFAKIICLAAGRTPITGGTPSFSDTSGNWAAGYIETAKAAGFIGGYPDGTFRPNALITRAEIAKLVVLGAGFATTNTSGADFSDIATNWAKGYIMTASNNGIVNGYSDGTFRPNNSATRAEASVMVYNWLANK